jgi:hypothetical protein
MLRNWALTTGRGGLDKLLAGDGFTVANYVAGQGYAITDVLNCSAWANRIGAAGPLLQATGANQPIILSSDSVKKAYLPAAANNTFTSPNQTTTGSRTITFDVALNDYTPAADVTLFTKTAGNDGFSVLWLTTDKVRLIIGDGAGLTNVDMALATGLTDATRHTISIAWADGVGATFSIDGVASAQVPAVKTLTNAAVAFTLGSTTSLGKVYSFAVSGLFGFDANLWSETSTNGATALGTFGETITLNCTGAKLAQIVASPQLLFDGTAGTIKTAPFTLNQPFTVYEVTKTITWGANGIIFDGNTNASAMMDMQGISPNGRIFAGTGLAVTGGFSSAYSTGALVFNGASSSWSINGSAPVSGNAGAGNAGGFTVGSRGDASIFGNIQTKEFIIRNVADSVTTQVQIQSLLKSLHNTP